MTDSYNYSQETIRRSRQVYELLVTRTQIAATITYGEVAAQLGFHHRAMKFPLAKIQDECRAARLMSITVLVVGKDSGMPKAGCDITGIEAVADGMREISKVAWPKRAWW